MKGEYMEQQILSCCSLVADGVFKLSGEKRQQVSHEILFDGGQLVQFHLGVLSAYSYLLSSCDAGFLIDPGRELGSYERYIFDHNIRLCGVFLTHMHSDFVAGHIEAGERFNVPVFVGRSADAGFQHITVEDDSSFSLGRLKLHFFSAAGHADDCVCMSVGTDPGHPDFLFTGDALDVPYDCDTGMDWVKKLEACSDETLVYPGHELNGVEHSWTTLGMEKQRNHLFNPDADHQSGGARHALHLESLRDINRKGPPVVDWGKLFQPAEPDEQWAVPESRVIDIRNSSDFAAGHVPYSMNIEANGKLERWCAEFFDPQEGLVVIIGEDEEAITEAARRLHAVGFQASGCTFDTWKNSGKPVSGSRMTDAAELDAWLWSENPPFLLDVRSHAEWLNGRIAGSVNIPLTELENNIGKLPADRDTVLVCASGFRSAVAAGILERNNFLNAVNLRGGTGAWLEEGKALEKGEAKNYTPVPSKCGMKS